MTFVADFPPDAPALIEARGAAWVRVGRRMCLECRSVERASADAAGRQLEEDAGVHGVHVFVSMN